MNPLPSDQAILDRARQVRLLALDVDGVLTDGSLYFSNSGEEMKAFNILDGQGIRLLQDSGVAVAIITARTSALVSRRAADLGIEHLIQGSENKLKALQGLLRQLQLEPGNAAYVGDDLPDLACIRQVALGIAVANAHAAIKAEAVFTTTRNGGNGAVREVCDLILQAQGNYAAAVDRFR